MDETFEKIIAFFNELKFFFTELGNYLIKNFHLSYLTFEEQKGVFVTALYRQRGKMARRLIHTGMAALAGVGMMIAPIIAQEFPGRSVNPWEINSPSAVLSAYDEGGPETSTLVSDKIRDKAIEYIVQPGDTVSSIADKFGISQDTIRWQNNLQSKDAIKIGQTLEILPVTGISHKVQKGDTVYSIAKHFYQ
jgi:LysM repeat protein